MSEAAWKVGAKNHTTGQSMVGGVLGVPFFLGALLLQFSGHPPNAHKFLNLALAYLLFLVLPCSACLSATLSTYMAPAGEERAFVQATFFYYCLGTLIMLTLAASLTLYSQHNIHLVHRSPGSFTLPVMVLAAVINLLAMAIGSQLGYRLGLNARSNESNTVALLLQRCRLIDP